MLPCHHHWCAECTCDLFNRCITDDALYPPRCCQDSGPIELGTVRHFLTIEMAQRYERRRVEMETPNRTYCSNRSCSVFLPVTLARNDSVVCPNCATVTCTICKEVAHGDDCPADTTLHQVLEMARENQWRRCPRCRRMVELLDGCNHIYVGSLQFNHGGYVAD